MSVPSFVEKSNAPPSPRGIAPQMTNLTYPAFSSGPNVVHPLTGQLIIASNAKDDSKPNAI